MSSDGRNSIQVNDNKAGMANLDKDKINEIIFEASKGSKYFENEIKRDKIINKQIDDLIKHNKSLSNDVINKGEAEADKIIASLKENRNLTRTIVHIDMDAFFAAVEIRDDSSLRNVPMAVGSNQMLSTSNYLARKFGVRAGMPGFIAKKLCPDLVLIEPDFLKYTRVSVAIRSIFAEYDPGYMAVSLDEAYLDLTNHLKKRVHFTNDNMTYSAEVLCRCRNSICDTKQTRLFHVCQHCGKVMESKSKVFTTTSWSAVEELRFRVFLETQITCSAGLAPNSLLAKIASDLNKPNGQYQISSNEIDIDDFISNLAIRKVPGIGKVSERKLMSLGINTCGDIIKKRGVLYNLFKGVTFGYFIRIATGEGEVEFNDNNSDEKSSDRKSISVERTFSDCDNEALLMERCKSLCKDICLDLCEARLQGKCVSIKLKLSTFELKTRAQTIQDYTNNIDIITDCASELLKIEIKASNGKLCLRLLGVRISSLINEEMLSKRNPWQMKTVFNISKLNSPSTTIQDNTRPPKKLLIDDYQVPCPSCSLMVDFLNINVHLDTCLSPTSLKQPTSPSVLHTNKTIPTSSSLKRAPSESLREDNTKVAKGPMDKYIITKRLN